MPLQAKIFNSGYSQNIIFSVKYHFFGQKFQLGIFFVTLEITDFNIICCVYGSVPHSARRGVERDI